MPVGQTSTPNSYNQAEKEQEYAGARETFLREEEHIQLQEDAIQMAKDGSVAKMNSSLGRWHENEEMSEVAKD